MLKVASNFRQKIVVFGSTLFFSIPFALLMNESVTALSGGTFDADVRIRPSLTLSVTRDNVPTTDITLNLDPASNPFDSEDLNIAVSTNNKTGYTLTMTTSDNGTNLLNVADSTKTIPTLTSSTTAAAFPVNKWGYKKDSGNYQPFVTNTQILTNNTRTNEDATTLSFAAKVDYTKESGLYKQDLVFAATPNMVTYYMQDLDPAVCSKDPIEAIDLRDNNTYYIAELEDGNCWMLQNLQLGSTLATTSGSMTLTPANTNISANYTLNNKVSGGTMPYTTVTDDVDGGSVPVYDGNAFYCTPTSGDSNQYVSCYYNWYTATASKGTSKITSGGTEEGIDVNESICPKGWVLPKGGSNGDFRRLVTFYPTSSQILVDPMAAYDNTNGTYRPGFLLSGLYYNTGSSHLGVAGVYWARTVYSTGRTYHLRITTSSIDSYGDVIATKYDGIPVRCIRETRKIGDIENMQDISPAIVANTNEGSFKALKDTRDNQYYMVSKLKDGNIWMLDNLNLDLTSSTVASTLTASNTNASNEALNYLRSGGGATTDKWPTTGLSYSNWTTGNEYDIPLVKTSGTCDTSVNCTYNGPWDHNDLISSKTPNVSTFGVGSGKIGIYYNYCAATAGSYCYGNNGSSSGNATQDICPAGWRMPTGGTTGDFQNLCTAYNGSACADQTTMAATDPDSMQYQLSTAFSGGFTGPEPTRWQGRYNYIWGATYTNTTSMYSMISWEDSVWPQYSYLRNYGSSVRCLAY